MTVINDNNCSWLTNVPRKFFFKTISDNLECNYLVVGAGYTGLSAARKLAQLHPKERVILVDAQLAGEGASGRNSGYLVDTTLNDGFTSNQELENYKKKTDIYDLGIVAV
jgi:ribulose 1,5-bisphosphate synthetase/thiazole synthase